MIMTTINAFMSEISDSYPITLLDFNHVTSIDQSRMATLTSEVTNFKAHTKLLHLRFPTHSLLALIINSLRLKARFKMANIRLLFLLISTCLVQSLVPGRKEDAHYTEDGKHNDEYDRETFLGHDGQKEFGELSNEGRIFKLK